MTAGSPGIRPRPNASDYPNHYAASDFAIGAAVIPPAEVKKMFVADLNAAGYLVVEVGIFPGKEVDLSPADFSLLSDSDKVSARPVDADAVAANVGRKYEPPGTLRNTDIYTTEAVTIARVPTVSPGTGQQGGHTTEVGTAVGVGIGAPPQLGCRFSDCTAIRTQPATRQATPRAQAT